jgi:hypothetical protein
MDVDLQQRVCLPEACIFESLCSKMETLLKDIKLSSTQSSVLGSKTCKRMSFFESPGPTYKRGFVKLNVLERSKDNGIF